MTLTLTMTTTVMMTMAIQMTEAMMPFTHSIMHYVQCTLELIMNTTP